MKNFKFCSTQIKDLTIIEPFMVKDSRGYFSKVFEKEIFQSIGINFFPFEQLQSYSHKGVIRGLHFQYNYCQDKLIRVLNGEVYDVALDLRKDSPTFGKWEGFYLSAQNQKMLYIPKGFAHGFLALEEQTLFSYLCGDRYDPLSDSGILWNDPDLNITWPIHKVNQIIISEKDKSLQNFSEFCKKFKGL